MRQKFFDGNSWYSPSLIQTFSIPEINATVKDSPTEIWHCETKKFRQKIENCDITLRSIKIFHTRNKWNNKGFPYEIFRHCETKKISTGNCDFRPPLLSLTFFDNKFFLEHRRVPLRSFSVLWDNKFSIENRDTPSLIHKFLSIPENFRKTKGFLYKAFRFGPVRQKISTKPRCPPTMHENFR